VQGKVLNRKNTVIANYGKIISERKPGNSNPEHHIPAGREAQRCPKTILLLKKLQVYRNEFIEQCATLKESENK